MGLYHYQNSINYMNQLASSFDEVKTNPKVFNQNWCDRQNEVFLKYEESLKQGLETLKKSTKNDHHAKKIVTYRNSIQRLLSTLDQNKATLNKNCDRLKNRQKRN
jgi:CII-binding regulator of phage lambda lysogenization HflD